jgi:tetratricopeptide (TPR) repeat protein
MPILQPDKTKLHRLHDDSGWTRPRGAAPHVYINDGAQRVKAVWDVKNGMWMKPNETNTIIRSENNTTKNTTNDDITEDTNEERHCKKSKTAGEMTGTISNELTHCPVCMDWYRTEIFQCDKGHLICSECKESLTNNKCPACRIDISNIRNRALEDLLETVVRPCSFSTNGCKFIGVKADLIKHEKECDNMLMVCPEKGCNCKVKPIHMMTHLINMHVHELLPENRPEMYHFKYDNSMLPSKCPKVEFELEIKDRIYLVKNVLLQFGSHLLIMLTIKKAQKDVYLSAKTIFEDTSRQFLRKSNKLKKEITELIKISDQSPYTHISVQIEGLGINFSLDRNLMIFPLPLTKLNENKKEHIIFNIENNAIPTYPSDDVKVPFSMFSKKILNIRNNRVVIVVKLQPSRTFCDWELNEIYQKTSEEWYEEALVHKGENEWQKSINSLHNCLFLDQDNHDAWFTLGDALYQKNKTFVEECYTPYSRCIELDSNNYPAKWNMSLVLEHVKVKRDLVAALKLVEDCEEANAKLINWNIKKRLRSLHKKITSEKNSHK